MENISSDEKINSKFLEPKVNPIDFLISGIHITGKKQELLFQFANGVIEPLGLTVLDILALEDKQFIEKDYFKIGRIDALRSFHPAIKEGIIGLTFNRPPFPLEEGVTLSLPYSAPVLFSLKDFAGAEKSKAQ